MGKLPNEAVSKSILLLLLVSSFAVADEPVAKWSEATLVIQKEEQSPILIRSGKKIEYLLDERILQIEDNRIRLIDHDSSAEHWQTAVAVGSSVRLLENSRKGLVIESFSNDYKLTEDRSKVSVHDLENGTIAATLKIPFDEKVSGIVRVIGSLVEESDIYLLTLAMKRDFGSNESIGYRLTKFTDNELAWSKYFESAGTLESPGAFILGTRGPGLDGARSTRLLGMEDQLLVQAGPKEHLLAVTRKDGSVIWKIPALWEYQRGFIGPSVWQYFIGRYGVEEWDVETAEQTLDEYRKEQDGELTPAMEEYFLDVKKKVEAAKEKGRSQPGWVFAGPVVLKTGSEEEADERIFVVAATSDRKGWANYLANTVVFELRSSGEIESMIELPRLVDRNKYRVLEDRIVWKVQDGSLLHLYPSGENENMFSRGDTFLDFSWDRIPNVKKRTAWLKQGAFYRISLFEDSWMLSIEEGGYVDSEAKKVITYPVKITNLMNRKTATIQIQLPFEGTVAFPTTNYSKGPSGFSALSSILFMLRDVQHRKDRISFTFEYGKGKQQKTIEFDSKQLDQLLLTTETERQVQ